VVEGKGGPAQETNKDSTGTMMASLSVLIRRPPNVVLLLKNRLSTKHKVSINFSQPVRQGFFWAGHAGQNNTSLTEDGEGEQ